MTIRLDDELHEGMRRLWQRDGIQPSEQIRRALRAWLEAKGVKLERDRPATLPRKRSQQP
jgi:hypothetical protein